MVQVRGHMTSGVRCGKNSSICDALRFYFPLGKPPANGSQQAAAAQPDRDLKLEKFHQQISDRLLESMSFWVAREARHRPPYGNPCFPIGLGWARLKRILIEIKSVCLGDGPFVSIGFRAIWSK